MKKYLNLYTVGRIILIVESVICIVASLCVLIVNGVDSFSTDHLLLLAVIAITIASRLFIKSPKPILNKAVLWMAGAPLLFISYEIVAMLLPYHPYTASIF